MQIKDVTLEDAKAVRKIMLGPTYIGGETRLERIDKVLGKLSLWGVERTLQRRHTSTTAMLVTPTQPRCSKSTASFVSAAGATSLSAAATNNT
jgi:hypothetical protein